MNIEITLSNASLKAESLLDHHMQDAIHGFFATLNNQPLNKRKQFSVTPVANVQPGVTQKEPNRTEETKAQNQVQNQVQKQVPAPSVSKVLPKIDGNRTLAVTIAETLEAKEVQEHWKTGIKVDEDGTKRYQSYYWCDCGSKGKRFVKKDAETLKCRECDQEIYIDPATLEVSNDGIPVRDKFGNFYIAREAVNAKSE